MNRVLTHPAPDARGGALGNAGADPAFPRGRWTGALLLGAGLLLWPDVRDAWLRIGYHWAYLLCAAGLLSAGLVPCWIRLAWTLGILDVPHGRKAHAAVTPLGGGIAVAAAFGIALLVGDALSPSSRTIIGAAASLALVGLLDDCWDIPAKVKLLAQLGAVTLIWHAGVRIHLVPDAAGGLFLNAGLTGLWVLGITNALNFFDGMDGLATGLALVTAGVLGLIAVLTAQPALGWFAAALMGSCLGFLPYNWRRTGPAQVFLGDAGSTFLGFTLAALALQGHWAQDAWLTLAVPILIFWVFIYDMVFITVARIRTGKVKTFGEWLAYADRDHLHHRMERLLGSRHKAVGLILLVALCTGVGAIALLQGHLREGVLIAAICAALEAVGRGRTA